MTTGDLRRGTLVMIFGPGAVVDFRDGEATVSGVIAGLEEWDRNFPPAGLANPQVIHEERLQKVLGVHGFRLPPVIPDRDLRGRQTTDNRSLVAARFPDWLQCPSCNRIGRSSSWSGDPGRAARFCPECSARQHGGRRVYTVPVRFVVACESGHLDDFPWHSWVRHRAGCTNTSGKLTLNAERAGLAGLMLGCPTCKHTRSLEPIFQRRTWEGWNCRGSRPWLAAGNEACTAPIVALQRGASNLYFPQVQSALSIPPWAEGLEILLGDIYHNLFSIPDQGERAEEIRRLMTVPQFEARFRELDLGPEELAAKFSRLRELREKVGRYSLRSDEYEQLSVGNSADVRFADFEVRSASIPEGLAGMIQRPVRVVRLREVRALTGFTRIDPPAAESGPTIAKLSISALGWLPAIEVRGEGIFVMLDAAAISNWEQQPRVVERASWVDRRWREDWEIRFPDRPIERRITARFLLVHSLAHLLIRQLTLECGYSTASLRERLYVSEGPHGMAGLLVYTASADADGTLGGLERQGLPERLGPALRAAIESARWCSSDPLCMHTSSDHQNVMSNATCHACMLLPETSCEEHNRFLDRQLIVGEPDNAPVGYFHSLISRG